MKNNNIVYKNFIQKKYLNPSLKKKLTNKYNFIYKDIINNLVQSNNVLNFLSRNFELDINFKDLKKLKRFNTIVIIGMGGSILGAEAIYDFLKDKIKKKFIFVNDIDYNKVTNIKNKFRSKDTAYIVISKSGNTIETLSNLFALKILKKNAKNFIIISEKGNNPLYNLSKKMNLYFIEHKKFIGGRFSVFSEVGMLPAYLMGLSLKNFRKNLYKNFSKKNMKFLKDSTTKIAGMLLKGKFKNLVFLNYLPQLNKFLFWKQQLIAESLGKNNKGFLPLISSTPKDHHSLLQLYLDGPKDKIFYIFSLDTNKEKKINVKNSKNIKFLNNKSLHQIKIAQKNALIQVLKNKNIPFREFNIKELNEQSLGELFSYFILEIILVAKLSNINPFNQPAVEIVKNKTKKILL